MESDRAMEVEEEVPVCLPPSGDITLPLLCCRVQAHRPAHPLGAPHSAAPKENALNFQPATPSAGNAPVQQADPLVESFLFKAVWRLLGFYSSAQVNFGPLASRLICSLGEARSGGRVWEALGEHTEGTVPGPNFAVTTQEIPLQVTGFLELHISHQDVETGESGEVGGPAGIW